MYGLVHKVSLLGISNAKASQHLKWQHKVVDKTFAGEETMLFTIWETGVRTRYRKRPENNHRMGSYSLRHPRGRLSNAHRPRCPLQFSSDLFVRTVSRVIVVHREMTYQSLSSRYRVLEAL